MTRLPSPSYDVGQVSVLTLHERVARENVPVVDLGRARDVRRLQDHQRRCRQVLDANKRALARLFQSGQIYSRVGARLARDLLLAHQHLLKVGDLLARLDDEAGPGEAEAVFGEVRTLLARTAVLTARCDGLLERR